MFVLVGFELSVFCFCSKWTIKLNVFVNRNTFLLTYIILKLNQFESPVLLWLPLQGFASKLARRHYNHTLQSLAWTAWRSVIESKWKQRVEKACQVSSCMTLS